ncbi:hypothetical protein DACRYDRAFT_119936 [Dacryopinax primogenitus]|uniref:Uncharacterized protein n=1 Tax=Dacryopinax primogenitus (strain DJM 731) TaxID=1858805 RepID=M5FQ48_DACPD|nr:uncharacterized protein DACRYDRAFT_119936 [Dacryopinax primogenitus]EJT96724.1 hypothetical protein DACRYDRAFT_119936 [Dacryopinax primogenitus]
MSVATGGLALILIAGGAIILAMVVSIFFRLFRRSQNPTPDGRALEAYPPVQSQYLRSQYGQYPQYRYTPQVALALRDWQRQPPVHRIPEAPAEGEQLPSYQDAGKDVVLPVLYSNAPPALPPRRISQEEVAVPPEAMMRPRPPPPGYETASGWRAY